MIPGRGYEAALFQAAKQWINLVRVYGDEIATYRLDALHQTVAVIRVLANQMQE